MDSIRLLRMQEGFQRIKFYQHYYYYYYHSSSPDYHVVVLNRLEYWYHVPGTS